MFLFWFVKVILITTFLFVGDLEIEENVDSFETILGTGKNSVRSNYLHNKSISPKYQTFVLQRTKSHELSKRESTHVSLPSISSGQNQTKSNSQNANENQEVFLPIVKSCSELSAEDSIYVKEEFSNDIDIYFDPAKDQYLSIDQHSSNTSSPSLFLDSEFSGNYSENFLQTKSYQKSKPSTPPVSNVVKHHTASSLKPLIGQTKQDKKFNKSLQAIKKKKPRQTGGFSDKEQTLDDRLSATEKLSISQDKEQTTSNGVMSGNSVTADGTLLANHSSVLTAEKLTLSDNQVHIASTDLTENISASHDLLNVNDIRSNLTVSNTLPSSHKSIVGYTEGKPKSIANKNHEQENKVVVPNSSESKKIVCIKSDLSEGRTSEQPIKSQNNLEEPNKSQTSFKQPIKIQTTNLVTNFNTADIRFESTTKLIQGMELPKPIDAITAAVSV